MDQECLEVDVRYKEQLTMIQQLSEEVDKVKSISSKEMRLVDEQAQQNYRINEEIKNVLNLTAAEENKLARGQIDE